jgi:hypothetical protein
MADIVIGIASSHTPQLSSGVDMWPDHALRDQQYQLLGKDAEFHTYEETLAEATPAMARELEPGVWESKYQRAQTAIESLSAARCYALGRELRRAVETWALDARVAVIASGGLTHFVIDEGLDRGVLDSIATKDAAGLAGIPRGKLRSGNSEILNWITAAAVLERLTPTVLDYVPGCRTPAGTGTGTGMAFARWD